MLVSASSASSIVIGVMAVTSRSAMASSSGLEATLMQAFRDRASRWPPVALIDRVEAAIAGIAHTQAAPANAADQQALQQTKTLSGWSREDFAIGPVPRQALAVGEKLLPGDIAWMVPRNDDAPLILWHEAGLSADLAGRPNLLASLVSPEHVGAGVRWIRQDTEYPRMGQSTPEQFAIPGTTIRPTRKAKA